MDRKEIQTDKWKAFLNVQVIEFTKPVVYINQLAKNKECQERKNESKHRWRNILIKQKAL